MDDATQPVGWEKVFVFISSTFNDMHAERDYLVKRVFPELQDWCERRKLRLVDIDLRWGVTEQDATHNKNVVKVCLSRIDDCRPFFLCFLGQRRGWVPKETEVSPETFDSFPDLRHVVGVASVTEMEVLHALINPFHQSLPRIPAKPAEYYERAKYAFFYIRDPSYLDQLPSDPPMLRETYTNQWIEDAAERQRHDSALEKWREQEIPHSNRPFHFYEATWDPNAVTPELRLPLQCPSAEPENIKRWHSQWQKAGVAVTGLNIEDEPVEASKAVEVNTRLSAGRLSDFKCGEARLSKIIVEELQGAIATRYPDHSENEREDELQKEIDQQEQFLFAGGEGFIPREGDFAELDDYVESDSSQLFVLTAAGGMGKSTLLANWVDRYRRRIEGDGDHSIHFRFIGQSDGTTTVYSLLRLLLGEIKEVANKLNEAIPLDPVKLRNQWPALLDAVGKRGKTVIVIDALNQLESGLTDVGWLPPQLPDNVKLIVSFKRGDPSAEDLYERFREANQGRLSEVKPFESLDDRRSLVQEYLKQYLKELDAQHLETLISLRGAENPLYLKVVLSELRVFGAYGNLAAEIHSDFGDNPVSAFVRVLERLENDPAYSPIDPRQAVPLLFGLLAHARRGLAVDELKSLFIQALGLQETEEWREAAADTVNLFLRQVRPFLARREGRYDFFFESFKIAAQQCYVASGAEEGLSKRPAYEWHRYLAGYYRSKTDPKNDATWIGDYPRGLRDLPYHMLEGRLFDELFEAARDETLLQRQKHTFPNEPDIHLITIQSAIEGASRIDDGLRMAEFVLSHANLLIEAQQESPLDILRMGAQAGGLRRAWELSDLNSLKLCVLWHFLLAWELEDAGRRQEARATLERLQRKDLPRFDIGDWEVGYVRDLLVQTLAVSGEAFESLQDRLLDAGTLVELCAALSARGLGAEALRTAALLDETLRAKALRKMVWAQTAGEQLGKRRAVLLEIERAASSLGNDWQRSRTLASIAKALVSLGELSEATRIGDSISHSGSRAKVLRTIATAQARAGDRALAFAGFQRALGVSNAVENDWEGDKLRAGIAKAQAKAGMFDAAMRTSQAIDWEDWRAVALSATAAQLAKAGEREQSQTVFEQAARVLNADAPLGDSRRDAIAKAQAEVGELAAALRTARNIDDQEGRAKALRAIAKMLARAGELEEARALFSEAMLAANRIDSDDERERSKSQVAIVRTQARMGEFRDALTNAKTIETALTRDEALTAVVWEQACAGEFAEAFATVEAIEIDWNRPRAVQLISKAQARAQEFVAALATALSLKDRENRSEALRCMAVCQASAGNTGSARNTYARALKTVYDVGNEWQRGKVQVALSQAYTEIGEVAEAKLRASGIEEKSLRVEALRLLAKTQTNRGNRDDALDIFLEALEGAKDLYDNLRTDAYSAILKDMVEAEQFDPALRLSQSIAGAGHGWIRVDVLIAIAKARAESGDDADARSAFAQALLAAEQLGRFLTPLSLKRIAVAQAEAGEVAGALETASKVASDGKVWEAEALAAIAGAQHKRGFLDEARATLAEAIKSADLFGSDSMQRHAADIAIIGVQADTGHIDEAFKTARSIVSNSVRACAMARIARACAQAGDRERASAALAEAIRAAQAIGLEDQTVRALIQVAEFVLEVASPDDVLLLVEKMLADRDTAIPAIATELVDAGAFDSFKRLLIPAAYYPVAAHRMCALLARVYPKDVDAIAQMIEARIPYRP